MTEKLTPERTPIAALHRNLLVVGAVFTVLLIAMGGVLCVTQSIRNCPDWPGCFGQIVPPAETGPVLEVTHRLLAGISSLLIVSTAVAGMLRAPRLRWVSIPPLVALALLIEVSYFGAQVVLRGLAPGWAAVDVGSALLVVALMVTAAVRASIPDGVAGVSTPPGSRNPIARLALASTAVVYVVMVSGILVAGKGSITSCLGWPLYNLRQFQLDGLAWGNILRLALSVAGIGLLVATLLQAWRKRAQLPEVYRAVRWLGLALVLEALVQVLLQVFGLLVPLLAIYTVTAAALWAFLVALAGRASLQQAAA